MHPKGNYLLLLLCEAKESYSRVKSTYVLPYNRAYCCPPYLMIAHIDYITSMEHLSLKSIYLFGREAKRRSQ